MNDAIPSAMTAIDEPRISAMLISQLATIIITHPDFKTLEKLGKTPKEILSQLIDCIESRRAARKSERGATAKNANLRTPARQIREAIVRVFDEFALEEMRLSSQEHTPIVTEMVERYLPSLVGLARYDRHRRIIDACAGRKRGPVLISRHGKRYIVLR